ncbi:MAG: glutamine--tRNA ligase/YqeY domain fusion protein [Chloroflexi bacterium]|nr:glutamine--tRNA ligase/YqeY domain fusion protein [Chloroflexota bacterium]
MAENESPSNFIRDIIDEDNRTRKWGGRVATRFPPEPNGYLHIGHAKSICLNFGLAKDYQGTCNLRFDDTNPSKEEVEYVDSIIEDVRWLVEEKDFPVLYASDYFEQMYQYAVQLVRQGQAFVCELSAEEIREYRGTLTEPGKESPYRNRTVEENLDLFERMRKGEFPDGSHTLRAKIDMASPNINMRDPVIYRILHQSHHRTGDAWCIYPMYDFAHCIEDSLEKITHSVCTLEFEDHRPLYDWFLEKLGIFHTQQIEFARLNINRTVMSKRKLLRLVKEGLVDAWNDPRMPTISGLRRRGYRPEAMRKFAEVIGVSKNNSTVDVALLEHIVRDDLNEVAPRVMAVLEPLRVVIENYPQGQVESFELADFPGDETRTSKRAIPFSRVVYIERSDFEENPPNKFFRLAPGREVRLMGAYYITCKDVVKNAQGEVVELICTYDPESRGGQTPDGRKVKGTIHWVSEQHALTVEVRMYDYLFNKDNPDDVEEGKDFTSNINPDSLQVVSGCKLEPSLAEAKVGENFQFVRQGYFCVDSKDSKPGAMVFNRTVSLRDTWSKLQQKE